MLVLLVPVVVLADTVPRNGLAFDPPGAAFSTRFGADRLAPVFATRADLARFRAAAASDPLAGAAPLLDRIGRDVIVAFVKSYGRTSHDTPLLADLHRATLAQAQAETLNAPNAGRGLRRPLPSLANGYVERPDRRVG